MGKTLKEVLEENDIILTQSGTRWVAKCPFHEGDRSPSFTIYPNETYFCFGCKIWGDAVKFLVDHKKMAPDAAMDYVGESYRTPRRKREVIKVKDAAKLWPFLYEVAEKYHENLMQTPGALSHLKTRGLSEETVIKHKIGYTDGGVLKIHGVFEYSMGIEYGLINHKGYELMSHRITIPNIPEKGMCDFIIGRTVTHEKLKYMGLRVPKPIYGLSDAWQSSTLFITEGQFDYLLLREWGLPSIVIGGTHITGVNISILRQRNVVIVPDNDPVGLKAALDLKSKLGPRCIILDYTSMDIKDVSEAGLVPGAREDFLRLVGEQIKWPINTSSQTLVKSFPALKEFQPLLST